MKLVEILARELEEWPDQDAVAVQDNDKEVRFEGGMCQINRDFFASTLAEEDKAISGPFDGIPWAGEVTREMWEAERRRIMPGYCERAHKESPTTPQWRGEGLPPVGTVCEVFCHDHDAWIKCKTLDAVTGSREMACATIAGEGHYAQVFWGYKFRPIDQRTPRDKWIEAAERTLEENTSLIASSFQLGILFDAGLAKLPEDVE